NHTTTDLYFNLGILWNWIVSGFFTETKTTTPLHAHVAAVANREKVTWAHAPVVRTNLTLDCFCLCLCGINSPLGKCLCFCFVGATGLYCVVNDATITLDALLTLERGNVLLEELIRVVVGDVGDSGAVGSTGTLVEE